VPITTLNLGAEELEVDLCPRPTMCAADLLVEVVLGLAERIHALEVRS